jgi:hypothetical protein
MPTSSGTFLRTHAVMLEVLGSPMNAQRTGKLRRQQQQHGGNSSRTTTSVGCMTYKHRCVTTGEASQQGMRAPFSIMSQQRSGSWHTGIPMQHPTTVPAAIHSRMQLVPRVW